VFCCPSIFLQYVNEFSKNHIENHISDKTGSVDKHKSKKVHFFDTDTQFICGKFVKEG
jgi:hypothetical protein